MKRWMIVTLLAGGCATQFVHQANRPLPETVDQARAELAEEVARIDGLRPRVGLPSHAPATTPPPAAEPPAPAAAETVAAAPPRAPSHANRCHDVRVAADEICDAAARICRLAEQIGDDDARRQCAAARGDCRDADHAAGDCR
jgi:hypothetical protein